MKKSLSYAYWKDGVWHPGFVHRAEEAFSPEIDPTRIPAPYGDIGKFITFERYQKRMRGEIIEITLMGLDCSYSYYTPPELVADHYYSGEHVRYLVRAPDHAYVIKQSAILEH